MTKKNLLLAGAFLLVFLAGIACVRVWDAYQKTPALAEAALPAPPQPQSLLLVDMQQATEPEGVVDANEPQYMDDSTLPSQLSKIKTQDFQHVLSRSGQAIAVPEGGEASSPVVLGDVNYAALPASAAAQKQTAEEDSKITMFSAPVQTRLIQSTQQYKEFKRTAQGKYPSVDFNKDDVLVLESTSNLPDKVFEIQDVFEENGKMVVTYKVNIFGLNQKTNSHSAVRVDKRDLPLELRQIL